MLTIIPPFNISYKEYMEMMLVYFGIILGVIGVCLIIMTIWQDKSPAWGFGGGLMCLIAVGLIVYGWEMSVREQFEEECTLLVPKVYDKARRKEETRSLWKCPDGLYVR